MSSRALWCYKYAWCAYWVRAAPLTGGWFQVENCIDVNRPRHANHFENDEGRNNDASRCGQRRMLKLALTDGTQDCVGFECVAVVPSAGVTLSPAHYVLQQV